LLSGLNSKTIRSRGIGLVDRKEVARGADVHLVARSDENLPPGAWVTIIQVDVEGEGSTFSEVELLPGPERGDGIAFHVAHRRHHVVATDEETLVRLAAARQVRGRDPVLVRIGQSRPTAVVAVICQVEREIRLVILRVSAVCDDEIERVGQECLRRARGI